MDAVEGVPGLTRFGSPWDPPGPALSLLRAVASRHGVPLRDASVEDAAAAVVAADGWMLVTGRSSFSADVLTPGAARSASQLLLRAAGGSPQLRTDPLPAPSSPTAELLRAAEQHVRRCAEVSGGSPALLLGRVVSDLAAGEGLCPVGDRLASYASLLSLLSD